MLQAVYRHLGQFRLSVDDAIAFVSAKVVHQYQMDSNTIFIAEIISTKQNRDTPPLLYQDYRGELKDKVLSAFKNLDKEKSKMAKKWVCTVCNYVYDGDIPFEKLPDDYVCPLCGVDKSFFEEREVE